MNIKTILLIIVFIFLDVLLIGWLLLHGKNIAVLNPMGYVAHQERSLMITSVLLMLVVVIPVFILLFSVAWKYRAGNTKAKYAPEWNHGHGWQAFLWGFPFAIILVLMVINWKTTHKLDPHIPLASNKAPIIIEVVALRWKWLFIYPEQKLATINYVAFPEQTPITFELTSDAPINSFWIPNLGGQMYAMSGMITPLRLMADSTGEYTGSTAEMSGPGFAGMRFTARSLSQNNFDAWISSVKQYPQVLSLDRYSNLVKPSEDNPTAFYSSTEDDLFNKIIKKYMSPTRPNGEAQQEIPAMQM